MTGGRHSRENAMTVKLTQPLPAFRMDLAVLERLCGGVPPRLRGQRSAPDRLGRFGRVEGPDGPDLLVAAVAGRSCPGTKGPARGRRSGPSTRRRIRVSRLV